MTASVSRRAGRAVLALLALACAAAMAAAGEAVEEHKMKGEVVLVLPWEREVPKGIVLAEKGARTTIALSPGGAEPGQLAAEELAKCLRLACGAKMSIRKGLPAEALDRTIVLAAADDAAALARLGARFQEADVPVEGCLMAPLAKSRGLALVARSPRGLLDGACTVLEETVGAAWDPPRMHYRSDPDSYALETTVRRTPKAIWTKGRLADTPAIADRGVYISRAFVCDAVVDWCARNKINFLSVSSGRPLPIPPTAAARLKRVLRRAQRLGIRVVFLNMTHRLPGTGKRPPASAPATIARSTAMFADQFDRFALDGMAWHTASEGIHVNMDAAYRKRHRRQWEAEYFNSYYKAIRARHPDAILVMLMGWVYMNPAPEIAKLVPKDTVAWVVPNTPIIDAARTDLDAYGASFGRVWYWLYSTVSADGIYPMVKCDYLEKYCREALKRGHGLMPQSAFLSNTANMMYLARVAWHGAIANKEFLADFGRRYYGGDARMGKLLIEYQAALRRHRLWTNNIHTRRRGPPLLPSEIATLRKTAKVATDVGREAPSELVRDRLKALAATAIRSLTVREPDVAKRAATGPGKPPTSEETLALIRDAREAFGKHYFGPKRDRFWAVLVEIEKKLKAQGTR